MFVDVKRVFKQFPTAQPKFSTFASVPVDSLTGNAAFTSQCKVVAERFDAMIKSMDDAAKFQGHIEYMGHSHKPRNVDRAMFDAFAGFLTDILSSKGVAAGEIDSWKGALNTMIIAIYNV